MFCLKGFYCFGSFLVATASYLTFLKSSQQQGFFLQTIEVKLDPLPHIFHSEIYHEISLLELAEVHLIELFELCIMKRLLRLHLMLSSLSARGLLKLKKILLSF